MPALENLPWIDQFHARKIVDETSIVTIDDYLRAAGTETGRLKLSEQTGVEVKHLLNYAHTADFLRVKGLGVVLIKLLKGAGCLTVRELVIRNPINLCKAMNEANETSRNSGEPWMKGTVSVSTVENFIAEAKTLYSAISY